ncbi:MAG: urease accessory protein UreE [Burkholderiaceae bacterium]
MNGDKTALKVGKLIAGGKGLSAALLRRASEVELDWDVRRRSRIDAVDSFGRPLDVLLPHGAALRGGDVLVAEDGSLVRVKAARQPVLVVTHCGDHGTPFDLMRAAHHLGERHVPLELRPDRLLLEPDHALAELLRRRHLVVQEASDAFEPESGAHGPGDRAHPHGHAPARDGHDHAPHGHSHGARDHGARHDHDQAASDVGPAAPRKPIAVAVVGQPAPHVHGPGCDHGHGHAHGHSRSHDEPRR